MTIEINSWRSKQTPSFLYLYFNLIVKEWGFNNRKNKDFHTFVTILWQIR